MVATVVWTAEHDQVLKALAETSLSYSQIAVEINRQFGTSYTRNSCIGRASRLGLLKKQTMGERGGPKTEKPWEAEGVSRRTWQRHKQIAEGRMPAPVRQPAPNLPGLRCVEVDPLHISLVDLELGQCRWPYGEGPFTFCGHPAVFGSYCGPHYALSVGPGTSSERAADRVSRRVA